MAFRGLDARWRGKQTAPVNRWLILLIILGLLIGFLGVIVDEPRAIVLGALLALGGLWALVVFNSSSDERLSSRKPRRSRSSVP